MAIFRKNRKNTGNGLFWPFFDFLWFFTPYEHDHNRRYPSPRFPKMQKISIFDLFRIPPHSRAFGIVLPSQFKSLGRCATDLLSSTLRRVSFFIILPQSCLGSMIKIHLAYLSASHPFWGGAIDFKMSVDLWSLAHLESLWLCLPSPFLSTAYHRHPYFEAPSSLTRSSHQVSTISVSSFSAYYSRLCTCARTLSNIMSRACARIIFSASCLLSRSSPFRFLILFDGA